MKYKTYTEFESAIDAKLKSLWKDKLSEDDLEVMKIRSTQTKAVMMVLWEILSEPLSKDAIEVKLNPRLSKEAEEEMRKKLAEVIALRDGQTKDNPADSEDKEEFKLENLEEKKEDVYNEIVKQHQSSWRIQK